MLDPFTPAFFRRLQQLKIHTRRTFLGSRQGVHTSHRRGHGLEFSDYRLYTPGDDFRYIDWGVYGRTDRLHVKQFREEQDLNIIVILDSSASMAFPEEEGKFEMAKKLSLALGYIGLTDGDCVTFSILGNKNTPKLRGQKALARAVKELDSVKPQGNFDFVLELRAATLRHKIPGKCFIISDFLFDFEVQTSALDMLRRRNFDISVIQVLAPSEISLNLESDSLLVIDSETQTQVELSIGPSSKKEYAKLLSSHIAKLEKYCHNKQISHLLVSSDETLSNVILRRLPAMGLLK